MYTPYSQPIIIIPTRQATLKKVKWQNQNKPFSTKTVIITKRAKLNIINF